MVRKTGSDQEAEACYKKIVKSYAKHFGAWHHLGVIACQRNDNEKAIRFIRKALVIETENAEAHNNLGKAFSNMGKYEDAVSHFQRSLNLKPSLAEAHNNLGKAFNDLGNLDAAVDSFKRALAIKPDLAEAHNNFGNTLFSQGKLVAAVDSYHHALALNPSLAESHNNLGSTLKALGKLEAAVDSYQRALSINPNYFQAHNNLGNALKDLGKNEEAIASFRRALKGRAGFIEAHSNLLLALHYSSALTVEDIYNEHLNWAENHAVHPSNVIPFKNNKDPEKRLKLGYVSPDFRKHSVAYYMEPILTHHDKEQFEMYCFSSVISPDETTEHMKSLVHHWIQIVGLSDEEIVAQIRRSRINILVDLAGHTANNSMRVFAQKPAPVQVSYLGYPNTTGLATIDYRLTDTYADPPGNSEEWYTEQLARLNPTAWCYRPMGNPPIVSELPSREKGYTTFGSFNTFPKLNEKVLKMWGELLSKESEARLFLKAKSFADLSVQKRVMEHFRAFGISEERILLRPQETLYNQHLELYNEIDIALDPFPYHGTTTTCEAMYMGVPVVTLEGEVSHSRVGVSLLNQVGLEHLIANTSEEYVRIASTLAYDLDALAELRKSLRSRMEKSPLMDEVGFTKGLEAAYRDMWQKWVRKSGDP